jgi:hypothetical protein
VGVGDIFLRRDFAFDVGLGDEVGEAFLRFGKAVGDGVGVAFFAELFRCLRAGVGVGSRIFLIFVPNDSSAASETQIVLNRIAAITNHWSIVLEFVGRFCETANRAASDTDALQYTTPSVTLLWSLLVAGNNQRPTTVVIPSEVEESLIFILTRIRGARDVSTSVDMTLCELLENGFVKDECRPRNFRAENFHSANVRGNQAIRVPLAAFRCQECLETARRSRYCRLRG